MLEVEILKTWCGQILCNKDIKKNNSVHFMLGEKNTLYAFLNRIMSFENISSACFL